MVDLNNRTWGTSMRELVAFVLRSQGVDTACPRSVQRRLSERIMEDYHGDVLGIPSWLAVTRADISPRFGPALDALLKDAAEGREMVTCLAVNDAILDILHRIGLQGYLVNADLA